MSLMAIQPCYQSFLFVGKRILMENLNGLFTHINKRIITYLTCIFSVCLSAQDTDYSKSIKSKWCDAIDLDLQSKYFPEFKVIFPKNYITANLKKALFQEVDGAEFYGMINQKNEYIHSRFWNLDYEKIIPIFTGHPYKGDSCPICKNAYKGIEIQYDTNQSAILKCCKAKISCKEDQNSENVNKILDQQEVIPFLNGEVIKYKYCVYKGKTFFPAGIISFHIHKELIETVIPALTRRFLKFNDHKEVVTLVKILDSLSDIYRNQPWSESSSGLTFLTKNKLVGFVPETINKNDLSIDIQSNDYLSKQDYQILFKCFKRV